MQRNVKAQKFGRNVQIHATNVKMRNLHAKTRRLENFVRKTKINAMIKRLKINVRRLANFAECHIEDFNDTN